MHKISMATTQAGTLVLEFDERSQDAGRCRVGIRLGGKFLHRTCLRVQVVDAAEELEIELGRGDRVDHLATGRLVLMTQAFLVCLVYCQHALEDSRSNNSRFGARFIGSSSSSSFTSSMMLLMMVWC